MNLKLPHAIQPQSYSSIVIWKIKNYIFIKTATRMQNFINKTAAKKKRIFLWMPYTEQKNLRETKLRKISQPTCSLSLQTWVSTSSIDTELSAAAASNLPREGWNLNCVAPPWSIEIGCLIVWETY